MATIEIQDMRSVNFEFLRSDHPELADHAGHAENYVDGDPQGSLLKQATFVDYVVTEIYKAYKLPKPSSDKAHVHMKAKVFQDRVDKDVQDKLHAVRKAGNRARHQHSLSDTVPKKRARPITNADARDRLRDLFDIAKWFHETVGKGDRRVFAPYVEPPAEPKPKGGFTDPSQRVRSQVLVRTAPPVVPIRAFGRPAGPPGSDRVANDGAAPQMPVAARAATTGQKRRVYELARTLGLSSQEVIERLKAMGVDVKAPSSSVDEEQATKFKEQFRLEDKSGGRVRVFGSEEGEGERDAFEKEREARIARERAAREAAKERSARKAKEAALDEKAIAEHLKKALEGHLPAIAALCVAYFDARRVASNLVEAQKWANLFVAHAPQSARQEVAKVSDRMAGFVDEHQRRLAQWLSEEWMEALGRRTRHVQGAALSGAGVDPGESPGVLETAAHIVRTGGKEPESDPGEALRVEWFSKAAELGRASARFHLARIYEHGRGAAKDETKAMEFLIAAAEEGDVNALCALGVKYDDGLGVQRDPIQAAAWYSKAAERGHAVAQVVLGRMYETGKDLQQDCATAAEWYQRAAEQGQTLAQFLLADLYLDGRGVNRDPIKGVTFLRSAAEGGDELAQFRIGALYAGGDAVERDEIQAVRWLTSAASQHRGENATRYLRKIYESRSPPDCVEALKWAIVTASLALRSVIQPSDADTQTNAYVSDVSVRDRIASTMSAPQFAAAMAMARQWLEALPQASPQSGDARAAATSRPLVTSTDRIVVASDGGGHATSVSAALDLARRLRLTVIEIRPGNYPGHLEVKQGEDWTLVGADEGSGPAAVVLFGTSAPAIRVHGGGRARVTDVTLEYRPGRPQAPRANAVEVDGGELFLERCAVRSSSGGSLAVFGAFPRVECHTSSFLNSGWEWDEPTGISVLAGGGTGIFEDCDILDCGVGIDIVGAGDLVFRGCRIRHQSSDGIRVIGRLGSTVFEGCEIFHNYGDGVAVSSQGNLIVRGSRIHRGGSSGVRIDSALSGTGLLVESCDIFENAEDGIRVEGKGSAIVRECRIHHGEGVGVRVSGDGEGLFEHCDIFANAEDGIRVLNRGTATVRECRIHDGRDWGIWVGDEGEGSFENCDIFANASGGVCVTQDGSPTMRGCRVQSGKAL